MIRKAVKEDIPQINRIVKKYDKNFMHHYTLDSYLDSDIYLINVYEENDIVKGFIICNILYENIEILLLFVQEKYRNVGIGRKLIEDLYQFNNRKIILEVSVENFPAYHLYKKMGFKKINTRKGYYQGIDAEVMEKII